MDFCIQLEKLKEDLIKALNESNLTIGAAYYVLKDVYRDVSQLYNEKLAEELQGDNIKTTTEEIPLVELGDEEKEDTNVFVPVENLKIIEEEEEEE